MLARRAVFLVSVFCLALYAPLSEANSNGRTGPSCNCHGGSSSSTTVSLSGHPSSYLPGQSYTFTVTVSNSQIGGSLGGFSLDASSGTWSNPGSNAKLDSGKVTHSNKNARSWTVDWTAPSSGTGTVTVDVVGLAANGFSGNSGDSWNTASYNIPEQPPQNQAPSVSNVIISPSFPTTTDMLTFSYTYSDPDGDPDESYWAWRRNGAIQTNLIGSPFVLSSLTTKNETWTVEIEPRDGTDTGTVVQSEPIFIQNTPPVVDNLSISPTDPTELDNLSVSYSFSDADLDSESGTLIQWYLDGSRVSTYDGASSIPNVSTRSGDVWEVRVTPSDGEDSGDVVTATIQIGSSNNPPSIQSLSITPTNPVTTDDIHMDYTFFDEDGDLSSTVEIHWKKDGTHISEFDGESTIPSSHTSKGEIWEVSVRASDGIEFSPWTESAPRTINNAPPVLESLNLTPENPSSSDDLGIEYQWSDPDGDALSLVHVHWHINGVHNPNYDDLMIIESGQLIRGQVWHAEIILQDIDGGESTNHENPESNHITESATIGNSKPSIQIEFIELQSGIYVTEPLEIDVSVYDQDSDIPELTSIWYRDGFRISSLDNQSLVPTDWLGVGQTWSVSVTADDGFGGITTEPSSQITIENLAPSADFVIPELVMIESDTVLDAQASSDVDGSIVAWFWTIGESTYSGPVVSHEFDLGTTEVNLTVLDEHGGIDYLEINLEAVQGSTISDFTVTKEESFIDLSWNWAGPETQFYVWRSSSSFEDRSDLDSANLIATTNKTELQDPIFLAGTYFYTVTVDVGEVENQLLSNENLGSIELTIDDIVTPEIEESTVASILIFAWIILSILISFGIGIRRRFS